MKNTITKTTSQTFKVGDNVEVWVESDSSWEVGTIVAIDNQTVNVDTVYWFGIVKVDVNRIR